MRKKLLTALLIVAFAAALAASCLSPALAVFVEENGWYDSKEEVALYLHTFGHLPSNYVTKREARSAGWENGSVEKFFPGCSIGGDVFQNREGLLPKSPGRT
ncbi:MAG: ribonuclease, partial [Oscillospiraceae bacterium]|nr:ribonuclease [Oscillospiraceae bacterium]